MGPRVTYWLGATNAVTAQLRNVFAQVRPASLRCPSSPFPETWTVQGQKVIRSTYPLIHGSSNHPTTDGSASGGSQRSAGGCFIGNRNVAFRDITDGTTNTILIGEQGLNVANTTNNRTAQPDSGPWMATKNPRIPSGNGTWGAGSGGGTDVRCWNATTVRQQPNPRGTAGWQVHPACNTPLTAAHPGGVQVALGDGSVRFINDSVNLNTLWNLADRNDGNVVQGF